MGMTVVEKILARASGRAAVARRRRRRAARRPGHVARERGAGDQPVPRDLQGHGPRADGLGPVEDRDHLRPPRARPSRAKTATNQKKVREFVGAQGIAKFHDIRGDVGRHLPPDPARERLRAAGRRGRRHRLATRPATARSARSPSASAPPRWRASGRSGVALNVEVPADDQGRGRRARSPACVGPEGPDPPPRRHAHRRGRELQGDRVPRRDDRAACPTSGRLVLCNMSVEAGATSGIVPADEETVRYLREEAGVTDPLDARRAGRRTPSTSASSRSTSPRSRRRSPARTRSTT